MSSMAANDKSLQFLVFHKKYNDMNWWIDSLYWSIDWFEVDLKRDKIVPPVPWSNIDVTP